MSADINTIIGRVQSTIGDLEGDRIQRGEYLSMLKDVSIGIAEKTESWVNRTIIIPITQKTNAQLAVITNIVLSGEQVIDGTLTLLSRVLVTGQTNAFDNGIYLTGTGAWTRVADANTALLLINAIVTVTQGVVYGGTTWKCITNPITLGITPLVFNQTANINPLTPTTVSIPYTSNPYRVQQVYRRNTLDTVARPCLEISVQAMSRQANYGYPFEVNDVRFDSDTFAVVDDAINKQLRFVFIGKFTPLEECIIDYAVDDPYGAMAMWGDINMPIPNYLVDTFFYGLLYKAAERLMIQGDTSQASSVSYLAQTYATKLREAMTWNLMFKDKNSSVIQQPYKFLSDGDYF